MRRKIAQRSYSGPPVPAEEYRMFANQSKSILQSYRLARTSMAIALPSCMLLAMFHAGIALALAVMGGGTALLLLRKKYGLKAAAAPLLCALAGVVLGFFFIVPLARPTAILREARHGF